MPTYVDASHNMQFSLPAAKWEADLKKSSVADIVGYQEVNEPDSRLALSTHCSRNNRGLFQPRYCGNPISWKRITFHIIRGEHGTVEVHEKHPTAQYNPARDIAWVGLRHLESGFKVLRINVHPTAGGTIPQSLTEWDNDLDAWKDWSIANYWLDLTAFTAQQLSREYWDVISLGGDYNAQLSNTKAWYYPGRMLPALYRSDEKPNGVDHLQVAHGSDVREGQRWQLALNSDHDLHLSRRVLTKIPNYPAIR